MKTKHTPGEWKFDGQELILSKKGKVIADISPCNGEGEKLNAIINPQELLSNAILIADAPILITKLREVFDRLVDFREDYLIDGSKEREVIIELETSILQNLHKHGYTKNANT